MLNPQSLLDRQSLNADFQGFLEQQIQIICQSYETMEVRLKPCALSAPLQQYGILKRSVLDVLVVGCLPSRVRLKFRKLHVENPLFKTEDGVQFQIDGHLECSGVVAAQVSELKKIYKNVFKTKSLHNY